MDNTASLNRKVPLRGSIIFIIWLRECLVYSFALTGLFVRIQWSKSPHLWSILDAVLTCGRGIRVSSYQPAPVIHCFN